MDWYYLKQGRQLGPVPQKSILAWLDSGFLDPEDLVWTEGMAEWAPVSDVPALGGTPGRSVAPPRATSGSSGVDAHPTPNTAVYATFSVRALAYLIDIVLVSVLLTIAWMIKEPEGFNDPDALLRTRSFLISTYVTIWVYFAMFESSGWQATIGKRVLGLRVAALDGSRVSFPQAFLRQIIKTPPIPPLQVGYLLAIFTPRRQALHDLLARTVVVRH